MALIQCSYSGFFQSSVLVPAEAWTQTRNAEASWPLRSDLPFPRGAQSLVIAGCRREALGTALHQQVNSASKTSPTASSAESNYMEGALSALDCLCLSSEGYSDLLQHGPQLEACLYASDSCLHQ